MTDEFAINILEQYRENPTLINEIETAEEAVWIDEALDRAIKALEQQPCEDCISREEAIKHTHIEYDDDGIGHRVVYAEDIEELPPVTPTIPEDEDNFDIGYNCGYADAMCDIGGES